MRGLLLGIALASAALALTVVASVKTEAIIVRPIVGNVEVLLPPGASPLFWKPSPQQVSDALSADIYVNTLHWPFERDIVKMRKKPSVPSYEPGPPAEGVAMQGFAILRMPNGDLNPHGWWLYAPNALAIASRVTAYACKLDPAKCRTYVDNFLKEVSKVKAVLEKCYEPGLKAVTLLPAEQYVIANFGIKTVYIMAPKGTLALSAFEVRKGIEALKNADLLVISDMSAKTPVARVLIGYAKRFHKPVVEVDVLDTEAQTYSNYLKLMCERLESAR